MNKILLKASITTIDYNDYYCEQDNLYYYNLELTDAQGNKILACQPVKTFNIEGLEYGQLLFVTGEWIQSGINRILMIDSIESDNEYLDRVGDEFPFPALLNVKHNYTKEQVINIKRLAKFYAFIQTKELKLFLLDIFGDSALIKQFVSIPSTMSDYFNQPGGLLAQSIKTAEIAYKLCQFYKIEGTDRDIILIAALFYDIHKIHGQSPTQLGYQLNESTLNQRCNNIRVLQNSLDELSQQLPETAEMLKKLLAQDSLLDIEKAYFYTLLRCGYLIAITEKLMGKLVIQQDFTQNVQIKIDLEKFLKY